MYIFEGVADLLPGTFRFVADRCIFVFAHGAFAIANRTCDFLAVRGTDDVQEEGLGLVSPVSFIKRVGRIRGGRRAPREVQERAPGPTRWGLETDISNGEKPDISTLRLQPYHR